MCECQLAKIMLGTDPGLTFDEQTHTYFWLGVPVRRSVSAVWKQFFEEFDAEATVDKYFERWAGNPTSAYFDLIHETHGSDQTKKAAIMELWANRGTEASRLGTRLHSSIEEDLCGRGGESGDTCEFDHYKQWKSDVSSKWTCLGVETRIYHKHSDTAGSIDSLWKDETGKVVMVDWKRCKPGALTKTAFQGKTGSGPCGNMADTPLAHYSCQQTLYATILHDAYDVIVDRALLVQLHPDESTYNQFEVHIDLDLGRAMLSA